MSTTWIVQDGDTIVRRCDDRREALQIAERLHRATGRPIMATTEETPPERPLLVLSVRRKISRIHAENDLTTWAAEFAGVRTTSVAIEGGTIVACGKPLSDRRQGDFLLWLKREAPEFFAQRSSNRIDHLPTVAEIKELCADIQDGWTPSERRARELGIVKGSKDAETEAAKSKRQWEVPVVACHGEID